jgi:hypothetical protein
MCGGWQKQTKAQKRQPKKRKKRGFLVPFLFLLALFSTPLFKNKL